MVNSNIIVNDAHLIFKNFSGKPGKFNPAGKRNFCVILEPELAEMLAQDGWNIKYLAPREEGDDPTPYLSVALNYGMIEPKIYLVTSKKKTLLDESSVGSLDWAEIQNVDLVIRPYNWEVNGEAGVKAYVKTMYVTIEEDEFADKYADIPDDITDEDVPF